MDIYGLIRILYGFQKKYNYADAFKKNMVLKGLCLLFRMY